MVLTGRAFSRAILANPSHVDQAGIVHSLVSLKGGLFLTFWLPICELAFLPFA